MPHRARPDHPRACSAFTTEGNLNAEHAKQPPSEQSWIFGKRAYLTQAGEKLIEHARNLLEDDSRTQAMMRRFGNVDGCLFGRDRGNPNAKLSLGWSFGCSSVIQLDDLPTTKHSGLL
jgi:hypothetical protein